MPSLSEQLELATAHHQAGRLRAAEDIYRQIIAADPMQADPLLRLGNALAQQGRASEAIPCYQQALALMPGSAEIYNNLGNALLSQGRVAEAIETYRECLRRQADCAEAWANLGTALDKAGQDIEAIGCFGRALELRPDFVGAYKNLGSVLKAQGLISEAINCFRRALQINPNSARIHSNLAYDIHFSPDYTAPALLAEQRLWNQRHAVPLARSIKPHTNDRTPTRRLRVGYVSPDFSLHPVGRFVLPLLAAHDRNQVEVLCYASVRVPDEFTDQCRANTDIWRNVLGYSDEQVAEVIREDRVDILVDLTMHMADNRLLMFARKPAPVQVTYLAYCSTTGLDAMDYRLSDPYLDPPGEESWYCEKTLRLPHTYWCYQPSVSTPAVNPLPALKHDYLTFGCLNNFCKLSEETLRSWCRILTAVPRSRLIIHAKFGSHRDRVREVFQRDAISGERVTFVSGVSLADYYRIYEQIDIGLDPFPYSGGTTTCDALWMGVPVVTLAGKTAVGRGGVSILSNVGLQPFIAVQTDDYVRIAAEAAGDLEKLAQLRSGLRGRMQASPLMEAPAFASAVENAYRQMWTNWCTSGN